MPFSARQSRFLAALHSALGTPYVWGGNSLTRGVDCSGLVQQAAMMAGIKNVPRTSQEQFQHGTPVQMNSLRPGDLIFSNFEGPGAGATHVVVYIGHGKVIAAPHTGTDVQIESLSAFAGHIVGARRYLAGAGQGLPNVSAFAKQQLAYHNQALEQHGQNPQMAAAALAAMRPIQVAPQLPLPTAASTLQNMVGSQQLQPAIGQSTLPTATTPTGQSTGALVGGLGSLHDQLLSKIAMPKLAS